MMRTLRLKGAGLVAVAAALLAPSQLLAGETAAGNIQDILVDARPCAFFTLDNVAIADPNAPNGQAWFAIPTSTPNYKDLFSLLVSAKLAGKKISVITIGAIDCGMPFSYAKVEGIHVP
jgi:hypothetical protein